MSIDRAITGRTLPGIILAAMFFAVGLCTLGDFGVTWDEDETYVAAFDAVDAVLSGDITRGTAHELPGYGFLVDLLRGLFARSMLSLHCMSVPSAFHLFHLVLSAFTVFLLYRLVRDLTGSTRTAILAALLLVLMPKFIAHSQNNPKDLPGLFLFVLSMHLIINRAFSVCLLRTVMAGLVAGAAAATHTVNLLLLPIALIGFAVTRPGVLLRQWWRSAVLLASAVAAFLLCWPWLWNSPWDRLLTAWGTVADFSVDAPVLYAGRLYTWTTVPWHYFLGSFLVSTPMLHLALGVPTILALLLLRDPGARPLKHALALGWIWCTILALAELRATSHYDGIRHFLAFLPGFCILAGVGAEAFIRSLARLYPWTWISFMKLLAVLLLAVLASCAGIGLARVHPYEDAYLNEVTNAWIKDRSDQMFEIEYWGNSYKEGAEWLNHAAESNAVVYCLWSPQANYHLAKPAVLFDAATFFADTDRPRYLMVITRSALYDDAVRLVANEYRPVFTITRQKGTLLNIYKNTVRAR